MGASHSGRRTIGASSSRRIQFGEGQFRDLLIEALRKHGLETSDMASLSVIELGCGMGAQSPPIRGNGNSGAQLAGIDLIENFIAFGRSQNPAFNIAVGDATRTDFGDSAFDIVLLHTVLSAIIDRDVHAQLLREARRHHQTRRKSSSCSTLPMATPSRRTNVSGEELVFIQAVPREVLCAIAAGVGLATVSCGGAGSCRVCASLSSGVC